MLAHELFVFVTTAGVDGNNNASERELRDDAIRRSTGRTNKTANGAKRRNRSRAGIGLFMLREI